MKPLIETWERFKHRDIFSVGFFIFLVLSLFFGTWIRTLMMNHCLWFDEIYSTKIFCTNLIRTLGVGLFHDRMPVYYLLIGYYNHVFGDSALALRTFSMLASVGSLYFIYQSLKDQLSKRFAWIILCLLWVNPVHAWYSVEVRHYSLCWFWVSGMFFFLQQLNRPSKGSPAWMRVGYTTCLILGVLTHPFLAAFPLIVASLLLFCRHRDKAGIFCATFIGLFVCWMFIHWRNSFIAYPKAWGHLRAFTLVEWWFLFFNWFSLGNVYLRCSPYANKIKVLFENPVIFFMQAQFFIICICSLIYFVIRSIRKREFNLVGTSLFACSLLFPLGLYVLSRYWSQRIYIERSLVVLLPIFWIVMSLWLRQLKNKQRLVGATFVLGLSVLNAIGYIAGKDGMSVWMPRLDWRICAPDLQKAISTYQGRICFLSPVQPYELDYLTRDLEIGNVRREPHNIVWRLIKSLKSRYGSEHFLVRYFKEKLSNSDKEYKKRDAQCLMVRPNRIPSAQSLLSYDGVIVLRQHWKYNLSSWTLSKIRRNKKFVLDAYMNASGYEIWLFKRVK